MRLVLDANEYVYAFGVVRKPSSEALIRALLDGGEHDVRMVRTIVEEVLRNTLRQAHQDFFEVLDLLLEEGTGIDEEFVIPYHRGEHYREIGFKEADALYATSAVMLS